jgi:hypothetical protein
VRRLFAWTAGLVGIAALGRLLAARRAHREAPALPPPRQEQDPAEELRRRLAASRDDTGPGAESAPEPSAPTESLDDRRARVHAKAQEAVSAMDALEEPPA